MMREVACGWNSGQHNSRERREVQIRNAKLCIVKTGQLLHSHHYVVLARCFSFFSFSCFSFFCLSLCFGIIVARPSLSILFSNTLISPVKSAVTTIRPSVIEVFRLPQGANRATVTVVV